MRKCWNLKLNKIFALLVCIWSAEALAQSPEKTPESGGGYYMFPINPGTRNSLAGTMGELRAAHFHSGLDIRTGGVTGLPVYAAAGGYISRATISTSGYGNALYVTHPNGHTTVYAHLEKLNGPIARHMLEQQYRQKTFELNLYFEKNQFRVAKGDTIAFSGNSGSSGGPHLHFEIRDANQHILNPLSYSFSEIVDTTSPVVEKVAFKSMSTDSRVNGQFGRIEIKPRRVGTNYYIDTPIKVFGEIGVEILAHDLLDNAGFKCGVTGIELKIGDQEVFRKQINSFAFSDQRNILAHMNYMVRQHSGQRFHKLYVDHGNQLKFYKTNDARGKFNLEGICEIPGTIRLNDTYGNTSTVHFKLVCATPEAGMMAGSAPWKYHLSIIDNTLLVVHAHGGSAEPPVGRVYVHGREELLPAAYSHSRNESVYLWDMRKGLPDSLALGAETHRFGFQAVVPSGIEYTFYSSPFDVRFPKNALFDTLYFTSSYLMDSVRNREVFTIHEDMFPLRESVAVTLKPKIIPADKQKVAVYTLDGAGRISYKGGRWEGDRLVFSTREFGSFTLAEDVTPPAITPVVINRNQLRLKISDERSGISKFSATINGQWVLMHYDYKTQMIWSEKLDPTKPFVGEVRVVVTDNAGNQKVYTSKIN
jgi:hypothetical protein